MAKYSEPLRWAVLILRVALQGFTVSSVEVLSRTDDSKVKTVVHAE